MLSKYWNDKINEMLTKEWDEWCDGSFEEVAYFAMMALDILYDAYTKLDTED